MMNNLQRLMSSDSSFYNFRVMSGGEIINQIQIGSSDFMTIKEAWRLFKADFNGSFSMKLKGYRDSGLSYTVFCSLQTRGGGWLPVDSKEFEQRLSDAG